MALLDDVKISLGITGTDLDSDLTILINACKADLKLSGLYKIDEEDELIKRAIILYCQTNFDYDSKYSEKLQRSYDTLKSHLSLSSDYAYFEVVINVGEQTRVTFDGEVKETDQSGTVIFYSRAKNHVAYVVKGITSYIDVTGHTVINI